MNQKIESAIANVQSAFPSVFLKEEVVSILKGLLVQVDSEEDNQPIKAAFFTDIELSNLIETVQEAISKKLDRMDTSDVVDTSTAEFDLNYGNTIELSSVDVNVDSIADDINEVVEEEIRCYFEKLDSETTMSATPYIMEQ